MDIAAANALRLSATRVHPREPTSPVAHEAARKIAGDYRTAARAIVEQSPDLSRETVRHMAQVEAIRANRALFPAAALELHSDLPDGRALTSRIPASAPPTVTVSAAHASSPIAMGGLVGLAAAPSTTIAEAQSAYSQWD